MKRTLSLILVFIASIAVCYAQKVTLALNLKLDSTYYLTSNVSMSIIETLNGEGHVINTIIRGKASHKVIAVKDSIYELAVQYESMGMHMDLGSGHVMDVNTDDNTRQDILNKLVVKMLHKPVIVVINKTGKVLSMRNSENLYSDLFNDFPQITDAQKAQFKNQMEQSFGEKAFKSSFQDAFAMFPTAAVGLNDKWVINTKMEKVMFANIKTTYVLKSITDNADLVHGDAIVSAINNNDYVQINGMPVNFDRVTGTFTADYKLDLSTGWITEAKVSKLIKGDMKVKDNPKVPGGATVPMSANIDFTMSSK